MRGRQSRPRPGWLKDFSRKLIEQRLCASAHNFAPVRSICWWRGEIYECAEGRVSLHTGRDRVAEIVALEIFTVGGDRCRMQRIVRCRTTCPAGTISDRSVLVWMPQPCCSSDMAGTSTPYARLGQQAPGGIRNHFSHSDRSRIPGPHAGPAQTGRKAVTSDVKLR
jgi:hypothetical protein